MPAVTASKWLTQALSRECWHKPDRVKQCILCGETKPLGAFYAFEYTTRQGKRSTRYESRCKPCSCARRKVQYHTNVEREAAASRARRARNVEKTKAYNRERQQHPEVRAQKALAQRLRKARMRAKAGDGPAIRAIYAEAMAVERIIAGCPVFDLPELGRKMHVDHIRPLSKGGKHEASNLQILPIGINMRKGVKCPL